MIVVIADDFSGAAEIAGIAWRYGLKTVLQIEMDLSANAEVIVVDTGSRSMNEDEAGYVHKSLSNNLIKSAIDWIFKKTDSVLRGHIITEIESLNAGLKKKNVLLIANNPSSGKMIKNGVYYINEVALHKTDFGNDPEFPLDTSNVSDILGQSNSLPTMVIDRISMMTGKGIYVPEIADTKELDQWASSVTNEILPAGGSDFFKAHLEIKGLKPRKRIKIHKTEESSRRFFVFASTTEKSKNTITDFQTRGISVCNLPCTVSDSSDLSEECLEVWVSDIVKMFEEHRTVGSSILHPVITSDGFPQMLNQFVSKMIGKVLRSIQINELMIEGGATASHLVRYLGWRKFFVSKEYTTGVVELKSDKLPDFKMIVKPGSYSWPEELLKQ
jgi:hypothetical protein